MGRDLRSLALALCLLGACASAPAPRPAPSPLMICSARMEKDHEEFSADFHAHAYRDQNDWPNGSWKWFAPDGSYWMFARARTPDGRALVPVSITFEFHRQHAEAALRKKTVRADVSVGDRTRVGTIMAAPLKVNIGQGDLDYLLATAGDIVATLSTKDGQLLQTVTLSRAKLDGTLSTLDGLLAEAIASAPNDETHCMDWSRVVVVDNVIRWTGD